MKNPIFFLAFLFLGISQALCQETYLIDDFSEKYYGQLFIADTSQIFSPGWVKILDKKTKAPLIHVESEELISTKYKGKIRSNIKEIPYGEQSLIHHEDYNFDGILDLAIMDGQNSCYHGPSFKIYLATKEGFQWSPEFTLLAQEYCGMFSLDPKSKTLQTMTKSGCCWHQFSEFKVKNNLPYPISIFEEGLSTSGLFWEYTEQHLKRGKMVTKVYRTLAFEIDQENLLLQFNFRRNSKVQILLDIALLYCAITDSNGHLKVLYTDEFNYSKTDNVLSFKDDQTEYTLMDNKIITKKGQKIRQRKAQKNAVIGSLSKSKELSIENLSDPLQKF